MVNLRLLMHERARYQLCLGNELGSLTSLGLDELLLVNVVMLCALLQESSLCMRCAQ